MYDLFYGIIILFATFAGAFVGLGGGVVIKPLLDLIGHDSLSAVNFISSCAVFSMSISATIRHIKAKTKINFRFLITLSIGSVAGGICGSYLFDYLVSICGGDILKRIQGAVLGIFLVASVIYINLKKRKSFNINNSIAIVLAGFALGITASFLGVGGGPINVAFLVLFFSMSMKDAAVYSVGIIFFSQLSKLITAAAAGSIPEVNIITLLIAVICAVFGGIIGAAANRKSNEKTIRIIFTVIVASVAAVNFCNAII